jgi:cyclopropane fatty-acyl-phospholipid synthase-like methyltransferase
MESKEILEKVNQYYTEKVLTHGATPAGVDWNSKESQEMRFAQLCKILEPVKPGFSILDYGCGFGSLLEYMESRFSDFSFTGFDISVEMIREAEKLFPAREGLTWTAESAVKPHDFVVASGIFNVRQDESDAQWQAYILETLHTMDKISTQGFSFNVLTSYSDEDKKRDYLYYADPLFLFDYCKRHFSKKVALLHDYPIYEFSILVRK